MKIMALVPARKASKRFPGKNWALLAGVPLWLLAVQHAQAAGIFPYISSDDTAMIADGSIFIERPSELAADYAKSIDVVRHADEQTSFFYDAICLLQPTSPLRTGDDIKAAIELLGPQADAVVSVTEASENIGFYRRWAGRLERVSNALVPNGAIYLIKTEVLRDGGDWYGDFTYAYEMPKERSIDIDTEQDLELARLYVERQRQLEAG